VINLEISKFTIKGNVVDSNGNPIEDIKITLDGKEITKSGENGSYTLNDIKPGIYTLEAIHEHIFFEPI